MALIFDETIDSEYGYDSARVYVDGDAFFVTIETYSYETCIMMDWEVAAKVHESLGRAIEAAKAIRATPLLQSANAENPQPMNET